MAGNICDNTGTLPTDLTAINTTGDATATNSGSVAGSVTAFVSVEGNASAGNTGDVGGNVIAVVSGAGDASITNSGSVLGLLGATAQDGNATIINSGQAALGMSAVTVTGNASIENSADIITGPLIVQSTNGNASVTNSGNVAGILAVSITEGDASIDNSGDSTAILQASAVTGNASIKNSGDVTGAVIQATAVTGNASVTNSGEVLLGIAAVAVSGDASIDNSGNSGLMIAGSTTGNASGSNSGIAFGFQVSTSTGNASATNSATITNAADVSVAVMGDASFTNTGSVGGGTHVVVFGTGNGSVTNSGVIATDTNGFGAYLAVGTGDATLTNSGEIAGTVTISAYVGNATLRNSGALTGSVAVLATTGDALGINSGRIDGTLQVIGGTGNATGENSGSIGGDFKVATTNGDALATNRGRVAGALIAQTIGTNFEDATARNYGVANIVLVASATGDAKLTNTVGSRITGIIAIDGGTSATAEFVGGGNYVYTLTSFTASNGPTIVETHGAPYVRSGNTIAVVDPTAIALADRSLAFFTGAISSMLQSRLGPAGPVAGGVSGGGPLGFAASEADRSTANGDAFANMPSLAMAYASGGPRVWGKAPPAAMAPVFDTVVWTSGFGGARRQGADGAVQRANEWGFGGAIGVDRQVSPALRVGVFGGAGTGRLSVTNDAQRVDSDYVFGGAYGRFDNRSYFIDVSVFGGSISNDTRRTVANNLAPNGLEVARGSYDGWFISPDVTIGVVVPMADYTITPKARVRWVSGSLDGYSETGSLQGLSMGERTINDVEERLGFAVSNVGPVAGGGTITTAVDISAVALQRLGDNDINMTLLGQNLAFTTPGTDTAFGGAVGLSFDYRPATNVSLFAAAEGTAMNDKSTSATARAGMRLGF